MVGFGKAPKCAVVDLWFGEAFEWKMSKPKLSNLRDWNGEKNVLVYEMKIRSGE